jgi:hypothetical protein
MGSEVWEKEARASSGVIIAKKVENATRKLIDRRVARIFLMLPGIYTHVAARSGKNASELVASGIY